MKNDVNMHYSIMVSYTIVIIIINGFYPSASILLRIRRNNNNYTAKQTVVKLN